MQLVISFFLKCLIFIYRIVISPFTVASCRFQPTCSDYAIQALKKHGLIKAIGLIIRKFLSVILGEVVVMILSFKLINMKKRTKILFLIFTVVVTTVCAAFCLIITLKNLRTLIYSQVFTKS